LSDAAQWRVGQDFSAFFRRIFGAICQALATVAYPWFGAAKAASRSRAFPALPG